MILTPKNWTTFQHYRDRRPPWIKLHKSLLDDVDYLCLPDASKAIAPFLWLLASEYEGGQITLTMPKLALRLRTNESMLMEALKPLIDEGFFVASDLAATSEQNARLDREEKEKEKEKRATSPEAQVSLNGTPKNGKRPSWAGRHDDDVVETTQRIFSKWPDKSRRQPNGESVPVSHSPILADRLAAIKGAGGSLEVCEAIADRFLDEYEKGGWLKAAENFFGIGTKEKPAPWKSYYKAHMTNEEVQVAP